VDYTAYDFDTNNHISNLSISRTPRSDICNTVRINYCLDRGSGNYQQQTFVSVVRKYSGSLTNEAIDINESGINVDLGTDCAADDYIMIDNEVNRVESIGANTLTLYNTAGVRTAYFSSVLNTHSDDTPIYILSTNSDNGLGTRDESADRELKAMESVWRYGITNEFSLDCDFISDDTTAQELREHYFDYLTKPHYIIEFDTFLNVSDLQVNNVIKFDSTIMNAYLRLGGSTWASQKFVVLNIEKNGPMDYHVVAEHLTTSFI
jgi:hypothetical protein